MAEQHICDMRHIKVHGDDFTEEIQYYLDKFGMTQKELALRLGLSIKHINSIMNNEVNDVSVGVIESLEYAFHLETGTLTEVYHIYSNMKETTTNKNIENELIKYGANFLSCHPELAMAANINMKPNTPLHIKLMMLKRFYGVAELSYYDKYLRENVLADEYTYENPNSKIWIRFCELLAVGSNNFTSLGTFRKSMFEPIFKKILNIIGNENIVFEEKIKLIKKSLMSKGIVLVTMPFIENSLIRAISLRKGAKRYIFLSDMSHSEGHIFFSLLHEVVHCYFPDLRENEIDSKVINEYHEWEKNSSSNYKAVYDAIISYEQCRIVKERNSNIDTTYIWTTLREKYPYVSFEEAELPSPMDK
ncbi:helix-turn-helix domain-containing protein [Metamycoplasma neophronis]|uniref:Helix-turn-helix transcriptional regulator n=1 Tax=Metamycoplasma neophronis TaxID=872983 RepID=A0ABY2Z0C2_9BACT|nr:helix-turn-helix transcriptional regulator [Metamycoplasma neophronis]TPR53388.1 helix-turn-helix transcriptional regulator [Metamycoplasma neophronis]